MLPNVRRRAGRNWIIDLPRSVPISLRTRQFLLRKGGPPEPPCRCQFDQGTPHGIRADLRLGRARRVHGDLHWRWTGGGCRWPRRSCAAPATRRRGTRSPGYPTGRPWRRRTGSGTESRGRADDRVHGRRGRNRDVGRSRVAVHAGRRHANSVRVTARRRVPAVFEQIAGPSSTLLTVQAIARFNVVGYGVVGLNRVSLSGNATTSYWSGTAGAGGVRERRVQRHRDRQRQLIRRRERQLPVRGRVQRQPRAVKGDVAQVPNNFSFAATPGSLRRSTTTGWSRAGPTPAARTSASRRTSRSRCPAARTTSRTSPWSAGRA